MSLIFILCKARLQGLLVVCKTHVLSAASAKAYSQPSQLRRQFCLLHEATSSKQEQLPKPYEASYLGLWRLL